MNEQEFAELSAGRALHALSPEDEQRYSAALAAHPEWEALADTDAATAASLAELPAEVAPPRALRGALLARIGADQAPADAPAPVSEAAPAAASAPATATGVRRRRGWFTLAASIVLVLAVGVGGLIVGQRLAQSPAQATLAQIQASADAQSATAEVTGGGTATAHWSADLGKAVLVTDGMPAIASDQVFELWYVRGTTAEPAGLFTAGSGSATAALTGSMQAGDTIAVTVEHSGGSPSGTPTTLPIVAIPTA